MYTSFGLMDGGGVSSDSIIESDIHHGKGIFNLNNNTTMFRINSSLDMVIS